MKTKSASNWSAAQSEELYGFKRWGANHFSVDSEGFVQVQPLADDRNIRLMDVIEEAKSMGLKAPLVIRLQDTLRHRVTQINHAFAKAIKEAHKISPVLQTWAGYDSVRIIAQAIKEAGSAKPEAIRDALQKIKFTNVMGKTVSFDDHNQAGEVVVIQAVKDRRVEILDLAEASK